MSTTITRSTYTLVTLAYWAFMLTDGALRMLVLLRFHEMGYTPIQLASLFLLYEFAGVVTNLVGGWIGSRFGLKKTLFAGLAMQIVALSALAFVNPAWSVGLSVAYVMGVQALAGISKDLTKMSSKSSVKLLIPSNSGQEGEKKLFLWVALLTGFKNALKGVGFFLGGFLLATLGFQDGLFALAGMLIVVLIACLLTVRGSFGKAKNKVKFTQLFSKSQAINCLSFARAFLFASRDVWFVVGLPIFLHSQLNWSFSQVGGFMAAWVIGYGFVQASAPKIAKANAGLASAVQGARVWGFALVVICAAMAAAVAFDFHATWSLLIGLCVFGFIFAINSSIHSYLILAYTDSDQVSVNVGFYYMANAVGRLSGTLLSGIMFAVGNLPACLWTAAGLCAISAIVSLRFPQKVETIA